MNCVNWNQLKWDEVMPGMRRKVMHAEGFTMVLVEISPELDMPQHDHPHEQATLVQEGSLAFSMEGETRILGPGDVVRIPSNVTHGAAAQGKPALVIDLFIPQRDEFPASVLKK
jgi:quercetin dioxygenase-like cupin family protein